MDPIIQSLLEQVSDLHEMPVGAYNIRANGESQGRQSTENIQILSKKDKSGIDIHVKANTKNESVHIPAIISAEGIHDLVYNDFYIGDNADVTIVAGCGVHNGGSADSTHVGIHRFFVGKNAKMRYVEKHVGEGDGNGKRIIDPQTHIEADENSYVELETVQIKGVDSTKRISSAVLSDGATLVIKEKIMTHGSQTAETAFTVELNGKDASANLISRSVAKDNSRQVFRSVINGNNACYGHSECDAIIMDYGVVAAIPEITANHIEATLIHEAAIGKIAGEQLTKLMTLGLTEKEAEEQIVNGFLK